MFRNGIGWDVHPLVEGWGLHLGCVHFPDVGKRLVGHSDADVVSHAICDALLGAAALGDIGEFFPDTDPRYKDYPGCEFLKEVRRILHDRGYRIVNVDCTVMSDAVRLGRKKKEMALAIATALELPPGRVSVKATTWEGCGAVGRGEIIACEAIALIAGGNEDGGSNDAGSGNEEGG
jgi:2-C-methyl-D-erythritol 2,4-cyclodiphosphate synthase